jgi:hypothetical protein
VWATRHCLNSTFSRREVPGRTFSLSCGQHVTASSSLSLAGRSPDEHLKFSTFSFLTWEAPRQAFTSQLLNFLFLDPTIPGEHLSFSSHIVHWWLARTPHQVHFFVLLAHWRLAIFNPSILLGQYFFSLLLFAFFFFFFCRFRPALRTPHSAPNSNNSNSITTPTGLITPCTPTSLTSTSSPFPLYSTSFTTTR